MGQEAKSLHEDLYRLHLRSPFPTSGTTSDDSPANLARTATAKPSTSCHMHCCCRGPHRESFAPTYSPAYSHLLHDRSHLSVIHRAKEDMFLLIRTINYLIQLPSSTTTKAWRVATGRLLRPIAVGVCSSWECQWLPIPSPPQNAGWEKRGSQ